MKNYNTKNLWTKFKSLPKEHQKNEALVKAMRHYDYTVNVTWVMAHYNAASHYIESGLGDSKATGGSNWKNVTPNCLEERIINSIEISPHHPGKVYITLMRYKFGDLTPYIYRSANYGKSWSRLNRGMPNNIFARVVREDPAREGLLYAGTENGIYISLDDGRNWQPFQLNLPTVPITDLTIRNNDLVASTQGRSFWILDDLTPLHQYSNRIKKSKMHFFNPRPSYRVSGSSSPSKTIGQNPPNGAVFHYY